MVYTLFGSRLFSRHCATPKVAQARLVGGMRALLAAALVAALDCVKPSPGTHAILTVRTAGDIVHLLCRGWKTLFDTT